MLKDFESFARYVVTNLVDKPDVVEVNARQSDDNQVSFTVSLDADDVGKAVGRDGTIARAVRTILRAMGDRKGIEVTTFDIVKKS